MLVPLRQGRGIGLCYCWISIFFVGSYSPLWEGKLDTAIVRYLFFVGFSIGGELDTAIVRCLFFVGFSIGGKLDTAIVRCLFFSPVLIPLHGREIGHSNYKISIFCVGFSFPSIGEVRGGWHFVAFLNYLGFLFLLLGVSLWFTRRFLC
jgi:hypothetical protein